MSETISQRLDARSLLCPEPVMMLHKAVRTLSDGQVLEVLATDPSTTRDIPKFCHFLGHALLLADEPEPGLYRYRLRKGSGLLTDDTNRVGR